MTGKITRQGKENIKKKVRENVARPIQFNWKGNLKENQAFLKQTIKIDENQDANIQVYTKNEILKFLEYGTRPHTIEADEADALRWFNDAGEPVFRQKVQHPGTEPQAALRSAIDGVRDI